MKTCPLFAGLDDRDLTALLACLGAKVEIFDKKYTIFPEGKPAKYIGILLRGAAQIEQLDYYGNRSIVARVEPGQIFGEAFACAGVQALPVTVTAGTDCAVLLLDCSRILNTCHNACGFHRQLTFNLMKELAIKNIRFHQRLQITGRRTTRDKLMAYLMAQAQQTGSSRFTIPFDRQELADYLEVDRSGLSAELSKLRREGVLECRKNEFTLL